MNLCEIYFMRTKMKELNDFMEGEEAEDDRF